MYFIQTLSGHGHHQIALVCNKPSMKEHINQDFATCR